MSELRACWKFWPKNHKYLVSNKGDVYSWYSGRVLKGRLDKNGYRCIYTKNRTNTYIHQMVLETWHGPRPEGCNESRHINGEKADNRPENLEWCTQSANVQDRRLHGIGFGKKLNELDVQAIRTNAKFGVKRKQLAKDFGVSVGMIGRIIRGQSWVNA